MLLVIVLSVVFLSEAIKAVPKIPIFIPIIDSDAGSVSDEAPKISMEPPKNSGENKSPDTAPKLGDESGSKVKLDAGFEKQPSCEVFEVFGRTFTPYLRMMVGDTYNGTWTRFPEDSIQVKGTVLRPMKPGEKTVGFIITPLKAFSEYIPIVKGATEIDLNQPKLYYAEHDSVFVSSSFMDKYGVSYVEAPLTEAELTNSRLVDEPQYLQVPDSLISRIKSLAEEVTRDAITPYQKLKAIEKYLASNYVYDKEFPAPPEGIDPVAFFLFESKTGVCWHYNSAFVLMSRVLGYPARLVVGYAVKPDYEWQKVTTESAHAWSEVPFEGIGWITFDATGSDPNAKSPSDNEKNPVKTVTQIIRQDTSTIRGDSFTVQGTVKDSQGYDIDGMKVIVYVKKAKSEMGIVCGSGETVAGAFLVSCNVPHSYPLGDSLVEVVSIGNSEYQGSTSDPPLTVMALTVLEALIPSKVIQGRMCSLTGRIAENSTNIPVPRVPILVSYPSQALTLLTSEDGTFGMRLQFDRPGNFTVVVSFEGSKYLMKSSKSLSVEVIPLKITASEVTLVRGESAKIGGWVHAKTLPGDGEKVVVSLGGVIIGQPVTDKSAAFSFTYTIPQSQSLGPTKLMYILDSNGYTLTRDTNVYARTTLTLNPIDAGVWSRPLNFTAVLRDDYGQPLREAAVELNYTEKIQKNITVTTNSRGEASFHVNLTERPENGVFLFTLKYPGSDTFLPVTVMSQIQFPPSAFGEGFNFNQIVLPAVAVFGLALYVNRNRVLSKITSTLQLEQSPIAPKVELGVTTPTKVSCILNVTFPQIQRPFPLVWGVGEPLEMVIELSDPSGAPIEDVDVRISGLSSEETTVRLDSRGGAVRSLRLTEPGYYNLSLSYSAPGAAAETRVNLKIVIYRDEVVYLFNTHLPDLAQELESRRRFFTAREILEQTLPSRPEAAHEPLRSMVSIFEETNYSPHRIERSHYERFYLSSLKYFEVTRNG